MPRAERDLETIFLYIGADSSRAAERWFGRLSNAIAGLSNLPLTNPRTHEDPTLRQLLFGNKPHIYRIIYSIDQAANRVDVIHVRHHARDAFDPEVED